MAARSAGEHPRGAAGVRDGGQSGPPAAVCSRFGRVSRTRRSSKKEIRWYQVPIRYRLSQLTRETESPIGKATETGVSRALTDRQSLCDATTDVIVNSREPLMEDARWRTRTVRRRALLAGWL